jgi:glycosyltransferase involved in cell wall biosynthesis
VLPHGIPLPKHRPDYPPVVDGCVKFYYVGRICYVKGIHVLLEAFSKVANPMIELHLIGGAGNKVEDKYMRTLQNKYHNDKRIIWHGKIAPELVYEETCNYHVSSSSSYLEAFGLNIAEALALGKPVLATRSGGGEMQIEDGVNGWLVPTNDVIALSDKIRDIAKHPEVLPQMSLNCHATSIAAHCDRLLSIYRETLEKCH